MRIVKTAFAAFCTVLTLCSSAQAQSTIAQWSAQTQAWQQGVPWCPGGETWAELTIPAGGVRPEVVISYGPGVGLEESVSADLGDGPERYHAALTDSRLQWVYSRLMNLHRSCAAGGVTAARQCISLGQAKRAFLTAFDSIVGADGKPVMVDVPYNPVTDRFTMPKLPIPGLGGEDRRPREIFLGTRYIEFYRFDVPFTISLKRYGPSADHCRDFECDYLGFNGETVQQLVDEASYGIQPDEYLTLSDGAFVPVCGG